MVHKNAVENRKPYLLPDDGAPQKEKVARLLFSADFMSASASEFAIKKGLVADVPINEMAEQIRASIELVQGGDMSGMEAMLVGQAHALQSVFTSLMRLAGTQQHLKQYQAHMNLALKAQAQCRATLLALTELKYPRQVVIAKQANISHGQQQINNGIHTPTSENVLEQTELLEAQTYDRIESQRLDARAPQTTGRIDKELASVEQGDRPKDTRRQGCVKNERLQRRRMEADTGGTEGT